MKGLGLRKGQESWRSIPAPARYQAREEGIAQGEASGRAEREIEMARAMKGENIDIKTIIKVSGLSAEEIEKL